MTIYVYIGASPCDESCAQVGQHDYEQVSQRECRVFRRMLKRLFPVPRLHRAVYVIRTSPHDFGGYREVAIACANGHSESFSYACVVQREAPAQWDAIAQYELAWLARRDGFREAVRQKSLDETEVPFAYASNWIPVLDPKASFAELLQQHPL